jgi:flagellar motor switch protein FliG
VASAVEEGPFSFLEQVDTDTAAELLSRERPATVAGVISTINQSTAEMILSMLPPDVQDEVIRRWQEGVQLPGFQARQLATKLRRELGVPA